MSHALVTLQSFGNRHYKVANSPNGRARQNGRDHGVLASGHINGSSSTWCRPYSRPAWSGGLSKVITVDAYRTTCRPTRMAELGLDSHLLCY